MADRTAAKETMNYLVVSVPKVNSNANRRTAACHSVGGATGPAIVPTAPTNVTVHPLKVAIKFDKMVVIK